VYSGAANTGFPAIDFGIAHHAFKQLVVGSISHGFISTNNLTPTNAKAHNVWQRSICGYALFETRSDGNQMSQVMVPHNDILRNSIYLCSQFNDRRSTSALILRRRNKTRDVRMIL
jgi:hypothetical protein